MEKASDLTGLAIHFGRRDGLGIVYAKTMFGARKAVTDGSFWTCRDTHVDGSSSLTGLAVVVVTLAESLPTRGVHGTRGCHRRLERRNVDAKCGPAALVDDHPRSGSAQRGAGPGRRGASDVHLRSAGGALADIVDPSQLLIGTQAATGASPHRPGLLVWLDRVTLAHLLMLTFLIGSCAALIAPAWQSIVPQLVPRARSPARGRAEQCRLHAQPCGRPGIWWG